jgi:pimeloyl-ACP methyl ester carboxylesterase
VTDASLGGDDVFQAIRPVGGPAVRAAGPPEAPAIVFVHGTRMTGAMWTPQLTRLGADGEFRVIALDLPDHGVRADERFTLDGAVAAIASTVVEHAPDGRAIVVGLSLGGYVAMALAAERPELVRGLVLSGATAEPVGYRTVPYQALAVAMDRIDRHSLDAVNRRFFQTRYAPEIADPIIAGGFWSAGGARALRAIVGQTFRPRLAAYPGPSLILNGEYDLPFRLGARGFARVAQDVRWVRIPGASHLANLDRPAAFSEAVRRFARSLPAE